MPLGGLASAIYQILRQRVPAGDPRISYGSLVNALGDLPSPNQNLQAYDKRLFEALGEIGIACHRHSAPLPALSSIVVQKLDNGDLGMPGLGYYLAVHPTAHSDIHRIEVWTTEYERARQETNYPQQL